MNDSHLTSPLPSVENPQKLNFWQSVGIATQLAACHSYDDQQSVESFWSRISDRIQKQSLLILFNQEQRPYAFSSWVKTIPLPISWGKIRLLYQHNSITEKAGTAVWRVGVNKSLPRRTWATKG